MPRADTIDNALIKTFNQGLDHAIQIIETYEKLMPLTVKVLSKEELLLRVKNSIRELHVHAQ